VFALAIRLYVAYVFLRSGSRDRGLEPDVALFENEYHVPLLSPQVAALLAPRGTRAARLARRGTRTRVAALALFLFNIVAVISYPDLSDAGLKDHMLWGALMLVLAVYGPGRFSLDRALSR